MRNYIESRTIQSGLKELGPDAPSMKDNLEARIDDMSLFNVYLDSKTIQFYGGLNEDGRNRFKIDHEFDMNLFVDAGLTSMGRVPLTRKLYDDSEGTEFIMIKKSDIQDAEGDYAIRADKYLDIRNSLKKEKIKVKQLEEKGGFKVDSDLTKEEVKANDGWLELAVGKNNALTMDYKNAKELISEYVDKADNCISETNEYNCFSGRGGKGMAFGGKPESDNYEAKAWRLNNSQYRSNAGPQNLHYQYGGCGGRFLKLATRK